MDLGIAGRVALVTAASKGLGRASAVALAREGAKVVVCARGAEALADAEAELAALTEVLAVQADVTDPAAPAQLVAATVERFGRLDIVVANAGIATYGMSWELSERQWQEMLDVNLTGVWHTAKAAVPHLVARGGGSMIFTSSIGGLKGIMQVGHYVAAKHGIVGLMRTMANELAGQRIRVNTVHPTNVDTHMIQNPGTWGMFAPDDPESTREKAMPGFLSLNALPVPWLDPLDISNAVLFLASDEARYITGVALPVDAGAAVR